MQGKIGPKTQTSAILSFWHSWYSIQSSPLQHRLPRPWLSNSNGTHLEEQKVQDVKSTRTSAALVSEEKGMDLLSCVVLARNHIPEFAPKTNTK